MTTLATGLPIDPSIDSKITPALRFSVQKATSAFQKDYCYDLIQAFVDEPEIADPIGVRLFLNFCLRKPETLVESWLDAIDQNVDLADLSGSAEAILTELDNFLEFVHGLIEIIEIGEVFKLAYHEIDAWNLCQKLLTPIQRRVHELAIQDRDQFGAATATRRAEAGSPLEDEELSPPELTIGSNDSSSAFYQAFVTIDKFLKHTFDSRVLLEPAKLVDELTELNERRTELQSYRANFPLAHSSTIIVKKYGRFGREEAAIDSFLSSDKFKELTKLKNSMSGAQLTRKPSTRVRKTISAPSPLEPPPQQLKKQKRSVSNTPNAASSRPAPSSSLAASNHIDPYLVDPEVSPPLGKLAFADAPLSSPGSQHSINPPPASIDPKSVDPNSQPSGSAKKTGRPRTSTGRRKRAHPPTSKRDATINSTKRGRKRHSKPDGSGVEDVFVIEKIIGESADQNGDKIYKVLWAGYPESDATWQFANSLDDCAAVDVWEEQKKSEAKEHNLDRDADGEDDESTAGKSPAALVETMTTSVVVNVTDKVMGGKNRLAKKNDVGIVEGVKAVNENGNARDEARRMLDENHVVADEDDKMMDQDDK